MTLDEKIAEAEDALHELNLGRRTVKVSRNGKAVEYTATTRVNLELYIANLKGQKNTSSRRPMGIRL
jgi:sulfur carrier protein ThiS